MEDAGPRLRRTDAADDKAAASALAPAPAKKGTIQRQCYFYGYTWGQVIRDPVVILLTAAYLLLSWYGLSDTEVNSKTLPIIVYYEVFMACAYVVALLPFLADDWGWVPNDSGFAEWNPDKQRHATPSTYSAGGGGGGAHGRRRADVGDASSQDGSGGHRDIHIVDLSRQGSPPSTSSAAGSGDGGAHGRRRADVGDASSQDGGSYRDIHIVDLSRQGSPTSTSSAAGSGGGGAHGRRRADVGAASSQDGDDYRDIHFVVQPRQGPPPSTSAGGGETHRRRVDIDASSSQDGSGGHRDDNIHIIVRSRQGAPLPRVIISIGCPDF